MTSKETNLILPLERYIMYYGLFVRVERRWIRVDRTTGYTLDTAKQRFAPLMLALPTAVLRKLPPVKLIDPAPADRKYAKTPW